MLRLKHWFAPPVFPGDEIKTRRAAILNVALLTIMLFTLIVSLGDWLGGRTPNLVIVNNLVGFVCAIIVRLWLRRGHVRSAGILLLVLALLGTTIAIALLGTIRTPTAAAFMAYVVGAGLIFGLPGILATATASSLIVLGLIIAENAGVLPAPDYTVTITQWIAYTLLFGLTGVLTHSATQSLRRALARADNQIAVRKHIEAELERRSHELLLLNRASHTLVSSLDLDQILANLLQQVDSLFSAVGAFWLLESDSNSLVCRQASGPASDQVRGWRLRLGEGLVGWVAQTGESVIVPDAMTDQRHFKGVEQKTGMTARSILCVPLTTQNRVIGVLQVMDTTQPQRFNTTHLPLAEFLAATAAIAIENARLYAASQQTAERLRESEVRYRTLFENLPIPVFTKDLAGRYTSSNRENSKYWMVNPLGHTDAELLPPQIAEQFRAHDQRVITEGVSHLAEEYIDTPLGKRALLTLKSPLRDSAGNIAGILGASMDITDRKRLEQELERQRDFALRVMNTMGQGLTITNSEGRFEFVNAAYAEMMGYTPEELLGKQPRDITYPPDIPTLERARQERRQGRITSYESRLVRKDGSVIPVLITGVPRADSGEYAGAIAVITDLTTQKQIEEQLRYLGTHDALTGIFNRAFFETELARLEHSREFPISIIVADLDDMKWTNDTRGHAAGDELLKATARILQSSFRASDILARIGGDEFAVLLPSTNAVIAARILNRVREKITEHNTAQPAWVIQLSLGVATATAATKLSETFKQADARMYEDKRVRKL